MSGAPRAELISQPDPSPAPPATRKGLGLWQRRLCWVPTLRGWAAFAVLTLVCAGVMVVGAYPFLAPNQPADTGPVVMEGWVGEEALAAAIQLHRQHGEPKLYVTGGPLGKEWEIMGLKDFSELGAAQLERAGLERSAIQPVPAPRVKRDRTYTSALSLKQWFAEHGGVPAQLTLISVGPHSRRSRMLFEKAFGPNTRIGIIAAQEESYNPRFWWTSSAGFRFVVDESIAYLYARLLFWRKEG